MNLREVVEEALKHLGFMFNLNNEKGDYREAKKINDQRYAILYEEYRVSCLRRRVLVELSNNSREADATANITTLINEIARRLQEYEAAGEQVYNNSYNKNNKEEA